MTACIIYTDGNNAIRELCFGNIDLVKSNFLIPHIGETFIDRIRNVEYEVKDVVRSIHLNDEYVIQVFLKKREIKKYK